MILFCFFQLQCCGISTNSTETGKPWESWYNNLKINSGSASKKVWHLKGTSKVRSGITSAIWCMAFPYCKFVQWNYSEDTCKNCKTELQWFTVPCASICQVVLHFRKEHFLWTFKYGSLGHPILVLVEYYHVRKDI